MSLFNPMISQLTPMTSKPSKASQTFWFSLSLTMAAVYGILILQQAFGSDYVVQDDARQHIFWMRRFLDPALFPNDLIADYFQSVAPWGYTTFYRLFATIGIDPMLLAKVLPVGLGLLIAAYSYGVSLQLLPVPFTAFLSSVLIQQVIWMHDDVSSATPRAFMPLLFLAFLYYLLRRQLIPCLVTIALEGLFYPQYIFVFAGILLLQPLRWQNGKLHLSKEKKEYWFCGAGLVVAFLVLLPYALTASDYGPTLTAAEARTLSEFGPGGRSRFFYDDRPLFFWFAANRSGIFPAFRPATIALGVLLPVLLRFRDRFPLSQHITRHVWILVQIAIVGLSLFILAHLVLFKLHLPSRYTAYTLRFVLALATALSATLIFDAGLRWLQQSSRSTVQRLMVWGIAGLTGLVLLVYPTTTLNFPKPNYITGKAAAFYEFLAQQPKDSMIVGVLKEMDNIPSFAQRSIFVGREYAIPYHVGYANQFRQRMEDVIRTQYSLSRSDVLNFIQTYDVDFWVLDRVAFKPKFLDDNWIRQYPSVGDEAKHNLEAGNPVLKRMINPCSVFEDKENNLIVLDATCIAQRLLPR